MCSTNQLSLPTLHMTLHPCTAPRTPVLIESFLQNSYTLRFLLLLLMCSSQGIASIELVCLFPNTSFLAVENLLAKPASMQLRCHLGIQPMVGYFARMTRTASSTCAGRTELWGRSAQGYRQNVLSFRQNTSHLLEQTQCNRPYPSTPCGISERPRNHHSTLRPHLRRSSPT